MNNIISEDEKNEFITFSEAKKRFIEELEQEIEKLHNELQKKFIAYANPNKSAYEQNIYLSFDFEDTIYKRNRLNKLFFVISSLKKLDTITSTSSTRKDKKGNIIDKRTSPACIKLVHNDGYKHIQTLRFDMNQQEIEDINKKNKELSKFHWSEKKKIKYSLIYEMGNIIINFNKDDTKDKSHIEFYNLLYSILGNKDQTEKYTQLILGKSPKHN